MPARRDYTKPFQYNPMSNATLHGLPFHRNHFTELRKAALKLQRSEITEQRRYWADACRAIIKYIEEELKP